MKLITTNVLFKFTILSLVTEEIENTSDVNAKFSLSKVVNDFGTNLFSTLTVEEKGDIIEWSKNFCKPGICYDF